MWQLLQSITERDLTAGLLACVIVLQACWILALYRRTSYLLELMARERAWNIESNNQTARLLLRAFARGLGPRLSDLASDAEIDFRAENR